MTRGSVVDPSGVRWRVRRRWYPWRRMFSVRDFLATDAAPTEPADEGSEPTPPDLPKNVVAKVLFLLVGVVVWIVMGIGRVLLYAAVLLLFAAASLIEWLAELLVMPIAVLLRLFGIARWPVEIGSRGKHFATEHAGDFAAAGVLRDRMVADIAAGRTPPDERESSA